MTVCLVKMAYFGKIEVLQWPDSYWVEFGIIDQTSLSFGN